MNRKLGKSGRIDKKEKRKKMKENRKKKQAKRKRGEIGERMGTEQNVRTERRIRKMGRKMIWGWKG